MGKEQKLWLIDDNTIKYNDKIITRDCVYKLYIQENLSKEDLAKDLNMSSYTISNVLAYFKIKKDPKLVSLNRASNLQKKYGVNNVSQIFDVKQKKKQSSIKKYGVDNISKSDEIKEKKRDAFKNHYGFDHYFQTEDFKKHCRQFYQEKYGVDSYSKTPEAMEKIRKTNLIKYGVDFACLRKEARSMGSNNSCANRDFENRLLKENISYEREFVLNNKSYDFKIGNILVEVNPTATHNVSWSPFGKNHIAKITPKYHQEKTQLAINNGYRCVHVWDWDNIDSIINMLKERSVIYARKCDVREIDSSTARQFLNMNHIQKYSRDDVRLGLYYNDELVSVMTFGKPRYNKKYQWEIIRYCSTYNILGGSMKLFKYFLEEFHPNNVVSYCDLSKFTGDTYIKLGFKLTQKNIRPSVHWYNIKTKQHFTDNLLRQQGFSHLVNHKEAKNDKLLTSSNNEKLMLDAGFVKVYDAGQATYIWEK